MRPGWMMAVLATLAGLASGSAQASEVVLYDNANCQPPYRVLVASEPDLDRTEFGNEVASVQVVAGTRGDLDKSHDYLQKAAASRPNIPILKELGVTQLCLFTKNDDQAMHDKGQANLDKALAMPPQNEKHRIDHKHIKMLKADPKMACEYSRDGQQDLDKKKMAKD